MNQLETARHYEQMNCTRVEFNAAVLLHDLISSQVAKTPERIAVVWDDRQLTYAELNALSDQIAQRLIAHGITAGCLVGVCCSRQLDMPALLIGILKVGAAYVPLDPDYPIARLKDMVDDSHVRVVLAHRANAGIVESFGVPVIYADDPNSSSRPLSALPSNQRLPFDSTQPAYVIYTSGSTGRPKGVVISHRSVVNLLLSMKQQPGFTSTDRILATTTLSFDISVVEMFLPLITGGSIAVVDRETAKDAGRLITAISRHQVNIVQATPAMWRMIFESDFVGGSHLTFYTGGEPLQRDLMQKMLPHCREIWNLYGPTEATVYASIMRLTNPNERILIGWPVANTELLVVNDQNELCPPETPGELLIAGVQLATEYLNRPELTAEKFVMIHGKRYYRTGDLARVTADGKIDHLGRIDSQIKLNGHRIELGEIESALASEPGVRQAAVTLREDTPGSPRLVGYVLPQNGETFDWRSVRETLLQTLPEYMVPSIVVSVDHFHYTPNGKLDRKAFPPPEFDRSFLSSEFVSPKSEKERTVSAIWQSILHVEPIGIDDHFFELGGNSLRAASFLRQLRQECNLELSSARFFDAPTIRALLKNATLSIDTKPLEATPAASLSNQSSKPAHGKSAIAIIGMAARFPGAANLQQFWQNLIDGVESIRFFQPEELDESLDPALTADPNYVPARGIVEGAEMYDAAFFAEPPKSAALIDPQQRVMLEVAYEALEDAAIRIDQPNGRIGVWAGTYQTTYHTKNLLTNSEVVAENGEFQLGVYNEKDYIATRIAYKLNLRGPAINVNTACSTSLVAVIEACNSLNAGQCDAAIAGACSLYFPQHSGHIHQTGSIFSPDGHCRPFDADGAGTLFSDGTGAVVLKRLDDALRDGDRIYATINGLGINNDGARKSSFSAPTISGEAGAIAMALGDAGFEPRSITYVEAHGTATPVGDPIEIAALQSIFEPATTDRQFCAIGSVKSNIGHTVAAAGMAGLIKTTLALHHEILPRTLHYQRPFAEIDFETSPFFVCNSNREWKHNSTAAYPRRAGVSSFGVGGTNAHVVLQESPSMVNSYSRTDEETKHCLGKGTVRRLQLWPISAKSENALDRQLEQFADHCSRTADSLENIAYTLQNGRSEMACRAVAIGSSLNEMQQNLSGKNATGFFRRKSSSTPPPVVFMFPGQGAQYLNMGRSLYETSPFFTKCLDLCCEILQPHINCDLRTVLFADNLAPREREQNLRETRLTQPALFSIGYSLGRTMKQWGIHPTCMIGHSIGEFAAACLAGVFSLEDGLELIAKRGALMQALPSGSMLSVRLPGTEVESLISGQMAIAAYNGPNLCVVAGPDEEISRLQTTLESRGVLCRHLHTSHAFHSPMMDCIVEPFCDLIRSKTLSTPTIPIMSTVTCRWLTNQQATDPNYWANHLRQPVRFADAVKLLWSESPESVLIELGPRRTLATLAKQQAVDAKQQVSMATLGDGEDVNSELRSVIGAIAQLWCCGVEVDWQKICSLNAPSSVGRGNKVSLPTYPFERKRYFIDPPRWNRTRETTETFAETRVSSVPTEPIPHTVSPNPSIRSRSNIRIEVPQMNRKPLINRAVREVLEATSGFEMEPHDDCTSFFEIGFDSLLMTQTAKALSNRFPLEISFRQLLENTPDLGSLTDWLDERLPKSEFATAAVPTESVHHAFQSSSPPQNEARVPHATDIPAIPMIVPNPMSQTIPTTPNSIPAPAFQESNSPVYALMMSQLQVMQSLMQSQLQLLAGGCGSNASIPRAQTEPHSLAATNVPSSSTITRLAPAAPIETAQSIASSVEKPHTTLSPSKAEQSPSEPVPKAFGAAARVTLTESNLSPKQKVAIDQFVDQYVAQRTESKRQAQQHRPYMADARTVSGFRPSFKEMTFPIVVQRSKGVHLWDVDGNRYVDLTCGFGSNFLGHGPDFMIEAMTQQLNTDYSIGPQTPLAGEVARLFSEITGCERVAFANTGSEAVLGATRLARNYTGKDRIVMFHGDYHGILDEVIVRGNSKHKSFPAATGIPSQHVSNTLLLEYGDPASLEIIKNQLHELAAVVVEPVQSRRPELQPRDFLQQLARITESADTALIMDEVISGLRIAPGGAQQYFGVKADIATYGKIIGGGMPIGVIAGKAKYMDGFDGGFWQYGDDSRPEAGITYFAGTFCRHPVAMAAAKRILEHIQAEGEPMYQRINGLANSMAQQLNDLFRSLDAPMFLANFGSLFKVQFQHESPFSEMVFAHLRRKGYFIWDHRPCLLTVQHTQEHINGFVQAFRETIIELQSQGLLSGDGYQQSVNESPNPRTEHNPNARPGKDRLGTPALFVADTMNPGRYLEVGARV